MNEAGKKFGGSKKYLAVDLKRKVLEDDDCKVVGWTGDQMASEKKISKTKVMVPCSLEGYVSSSGAGAGRSGFPPRSRPFSSSLDERQVAPCLPEADDRCDSGRSYESGQPGLGMASSDDLRKRESQVLHSPQQNKGGTPPLVTEQTRGSAFLMQVGEKNAIFSLISIFGNFCR